MTHFKFSVSEFAIPVIKRGSIIRESILASLDFGIKIHQELQNQYIQQCSGYQSEVPLKYSTTHSGHRFTLSGRADGVYKSDDIILVEEIKTAASPKRLIEKLEQDDYHPYRLQLLTYTHIFMQQENKKIKAQLAIAPLRGSRKKPTTYSVEYNQAWYENWLAARFKQIIAEDTRTKAIYKRRKNLAKKVSFPFPTPRLYQSELMTSVQNITIKGDRGLIQAPTGIGKTMGVLIPSLGEALGRGAPLWYLTPKNSQFDVVEKAILNIQKRNPVKAFILTAKKKLCLNTELICDEDHCTFAKDHHTKVTDNKLITKLRRKKILNSRNLRAIGHKYQVCPYFLGSEVIPDFDIIVGDYNYVFSPRAALTSQIARLSKAKRPNLLIDEAHNLYSRGIDYFSQTLCLEDFYSADMDQTGLVKKWLKIVSLAETIFSICRPKNKFTEKIKPPLDLFQEVSQTLSAFLFSYLSEKQDITDDDHVLTIFFKWTAFTELLELAGEESFVLYDMDKENIKVICCNAAPFLQGTLAEFNSVIAFSATLKPFNFFRTLSGFANDCHTIEFDTPFPSNNRKILIIPQVSTKYRQRQREYPRIADAIKRITMIEKGHYFIFGPSYQFIRELQVHLTATADSLISIQEGAMTQKELSALEIKIQQSQPTHLILGVQGGSLSEGVDFHSPHLKGVFVLGPALPQFNLENKLRQEYYEKEFGMGFNYSFSYPAMAKSIQAAGRVIRSESKKGLIIFMDDRFLKKDYMESMPKFWFEKSPNELAESGLLASIKKFWANSPQEGA